MLLQLGYIHDSMKQHDLKKSVAIRLRVQKSGKLTSWGNGSFSHDLRQFWHHPRWLALGFRNHQHYLRAAMAATAAPLAIAQYFLFQIGISHFALYVIE